MPDIHELFEETHAKFVALNSDPCSGTSPIRSLSDCERTGVTSSLYGLIETPASSIATTTGGNLNLSPESAITSSLGFIFNDLENYFEAVGGRAKIMVHHFMEVNEMDYVFIFYLSNTVFSCRKTTL